MSNESYFNLSYDSSDLGDIHNEERKKHIFKQLSKKHKFISFNKKQEKNIKKELPNIYSRERNTSIRTNSIKTLNNLDNATKSPVKFRKYRLIDIYNYKKIKSDEIISNEYHKPVKHNEKSNYFKKNLLIDLIE